MTFLQQGRGYPDISMLAVSYQIVVAGSVESVYGTSASAPGTLQWCVWR